MVQSVPLLRASLPACLLTPRALVVAGWGSFGCGVTEQHIKDTADNFVKLGLVDAGYKILQIDDCCAPQRHAPLSAAGSLSLGSDASRRTQGATRPTAPPTAA